MGFGSLFGSIGKAVRRPFKDIHKAVKGTGGFMNRGFGKMTHGINKTGKALTGRGGKPTEPSEGGASVGRSSGGFMSKVRGQVQKETPLADKAAEISGPPKVKGSQGKKPGEWKGSKYMGAK